MDFADYFPKTTKDVEVMFEELLGIVDGIETPAAAGAADESADGSRNSRPSSSKRRGQVTLIMPGWEACLRTLSLCKLCKLVVQNYQGIDLDLLLTGAVVHDIGKTQELAYTRASATPMEGQLLGHMILELEIVNQKIAQIEDFPAGTQDS